MKASKSVMIQFNRALSKWKGLALFLVKGLKNKALPSRMPMDRKVKMNLESSWKVPICLFKRSSGLNFHLWKCSSLLVFVFLFVAVSVFAQAGNVTITGRLKDKATKEWMPFVNVLMKTEADSTFVMGTISNEEGRFTLSKVTHGRYFLEFSFLGYARIRQNLYVGTLSDFLDLKTIEMEEDSKKLNEVTVIGKLEDVSSKMDKKTFDLDKNLTQGGGSVLQSMQNLPGVTVQDGKVQLRGSDRITVLIDGKQTALTGFGNQTSLDNIPASAVEKIEIINNPGAKYDANGNAGIINIVFRKENKEGFNGKVGLSSGLGALWIKKANLPTIRPQYQFTPKVNPSLSLNYRKNKVNVFFQGDYLFTQTLNKNEFVTRTYDSGEIITQQTKRNRNTGIVTGKTGFDWSINDQSSLSVSGLFSSERIIDRGDEPFFSNQSSERTQLWQFLEDELKTTVTASSAYQYKFKEPGHLLNIGLNYTYHRENEKYFFDNIMPTFSGKDAFKLISDEHVADLQVDYIKPLKYGRFEGGLKFRRRVIPTNMQFIPGINSPLDTNAGGAATYRETIPALYGTYVYETEKVEMEAGLRMEYVGLNYEVNPNHNTYKSDGYTYTQPFPNLRFAYKINENNKFSVFYNRRVDRPNEVDIRIFPKYDDAGIIKIGNPGLSPQYTQSVELGYKSSFKQGYFYSALYHRWSEGTITRIASTALGSTLIYNIFQNAGRSYNTGIEVVVSTKVASWYDINLNLNGYYNQIDAFSVLNRYPVESSFSAEQQEMISGNAKLNNVFHLSGGWDAQLTAIYLAPDIIPQGTIGTRFSLDAGLKKKVQRGNGELFVNATDLLNTMRVKRKIQGNGFQYVSTDYYETQVIRAGYSYKF